MASVDPAMRLAFGPGDPPLHLRVEMAQHPILIPETGEHRLAEGLKNRPSGLILGN